MTGAQSSTGAGARILIVEDSPTQAEALRYLLEEQGYRVAGAANGTQALLAARQEKPALILSDIVMPGMDGYAFCRAVKSDDQLKDVPVILVTSLSSAGDVVKGLQCGADNFIRKPYENKYLLARINYALTNRELREKEKVQIGVHISLAGERHFITADRQQILDLLISTYEEAVHLNDSLMAREEELARANLTLAGLYRIAKVLNTATNERQVTDQVLERVMDLPGVQAAWIVLREGEAGFRLAGARGLPPALQAPGAMEGDCLCRRRLLSGEGAQAANVLECERLQKAQGDTRGLRCHASIPLWAGDRTVGVMNLVGSREGLFRDEELRILNGVGSQIALALERVGLREHLETEVEDRTAALRLEIKERELAEDALRRSEERYRLLAEAAHDDIVIVGRDGSLEYVNSAAATKFGVSPGQLVGKRLADLFPPEVIASQAEGIEKVFRTGEAVYQEFEAVFPSQRLWLGAWVVPLRRDGGDVYAALVVARDLTERRQLEEQLRQTQKMDAIGQLAGGIAHDFNNILTTIEGYSDLLTEALDDSDARKQDAQEIAKAAHRASGLTRQLLAFSRRQILAPKVLDLRAIVEGMHQMLRRLIGESIELVVVPGRDLSRVKADPHQMEQVLMNLAINARDAMSPGGTLTVETMNAFLDEEDVRQQVDVRPGPYVVLAVTDTGSGIDAETLSRIFEPFFTTKEHGKGTGLGLSTVYGIVKQSGGHITVDSEPGRGTTFKIYLPNAEEAVEHVEPDSAQPQPVGGSEAVLVVDDEEGIRKVVCRVLRANGYTVLDTSDPTVGLALSAAHPGVIHLLLTDVVLPQMSGTVLAERIMQERPGTKVLYMSGYTNDAVASHGLLKRGHAFLQKPFTPAAILRRVREVLDAAQEDSS